MKVLIGGGSGFIGKALAEKLDFLGHEVVVISRHAQGENQVMWSGENFERAIAQADAVVNLAGVNLFDKRWSAHFKREIEDSRVHSVTLLADALARREKPLDVFVQGSAIGFYGSHNSTIDYDEDTAAGNDYLARTCQNWEAAALPLKKNVLRLVTVRTGVVLGHGGGALESMMKPFKYFVGGVLGSGEQWVSWIHVGDIVKLIVHAIENSSFEGIYNGTAPQPVTHREQVKLMAKHMKRPCVFPVPAFVIRLLLGEVADLVVNGQRVLPRRAMEQGFAFDYPTIESAFDNLF